MKRMLNNYRRMTFSLAYGHKNRHLVTFLGDRIKFHNKKEKFN